MTNSAPLQAGRLPAVIRDYLAAHHARDVAAAARSFTPTAVVTDEGHTFVGTEEIRQFLAEAGTQFTFTTTLVGGQRLDATHWVATNRLEGDFPGGIVELDYRFTLADDLISELAIAPR